MPSDLEPGDAVAQFRRQVQRGLGAGLSPAKASVARASSRSIPAGSGPRPITSTCAAPSAGNRLTAI
jgi:hypothetical protein